jgi:hypothetical protein
MIDAANMAAFHVFPGQIRCPACNCYARVDAERARLIVSCRHRSCERYGVRYATPMPTINCERIEDTPE